MPLPKSTSSLNPRKSKHSSGPNSKRILKSTTPQKHSSKSASVDPNVKSADISSGEKIQLLPFAVTPSKSLLYSSCKGQYTFIGKGCGVGLQGEKLTYKSAWDGFERSLSTARIPCKTVARYPVIARWRNDVEYVAAGIYCFQPYCVTGELDPP